MPTRWVEPTCMERSDVVHSTFVWWIRSGKGWFGGRLARRERYRKDPPNVSSAGGWAQHDEAPAWLLRGIRINGKE